MAAGALTEKTQAVSAPVNSAPLGRGIGRRMCYLVVPNEVVELSQYCTRFRFHNGRLGTGPGKLSNCVHGVPERYDEELDAGTIGTAQHAGATVTGNRV